MAATDAADHRIDAIAPTPLKRTLLIAALAFIVSRLIVFAAVLLPLLVHPDAALPSPQDRVLVEFDAATIDAALQRLTTINDAGWYHEIAVEGYDTRPFDATLQANWAFFPLHPLLWRAAIAVFGDGPQVAIGLAHLALAFALVLLHRLVLARGRSVDTADRAVFMLALFPVSYFLSFPWTESLFLALTIGAAVAAQRGRWGWVALLCAGASATRLAGLFVQPMLGVDAWRRRVLQPRVLLALAVIPLGLAAFMAWLWWRTGNPLAFSAVQAAWGREFGLPVRALGVIALRPWEIAADWNVRWLNLGALFLGIAALRHFLRRREFDFAIFIGLGLLAPLLTGNITSLSRYLLGLFPIAIALADWGKRPWFERIWFASSVATLTLMSAAFGLGFTFAGT